MPVTAIARPRTRRWEAILLAFSLILGLTVAATTPASASVDGGTLDTTFGSAGHLSLAANIRSIKVDSQNRAVVAGTVGTGWNCQIYVARLTPGGVLDDTFSTDGFDTFGMQDACGHYERVYVTIGPADTVFVSAPKFQSSNPGAIADFLTRKYLEDGSVDTSWGTNGDVQTDIRGSDTPLSAAVIGTDLIIVGKSDDSTQSPRYKSVIVRYDSTGSLVDTFGLNGIAQFAIKTAGSTDEFDVVAVYDDGKIIISGDSTHNYTGTTIVYRHLLRLLSDGSPDPTFNSGTPLVLHPDNAGADIVTGLVLSDPTDSATSGIITAGHSSNRVYVVRVDAAGSLDTNFNGTGIKDYTTGTPLDGQKVSGMEIQNGKLVISGGGFSADLFVLRADAATGDLDTTFSTAGTAGWDLITGDRGRGLTIDNNGRYLVLSAPDTNTASGRVYAYNGSPPPSAPTNVAVSGGSVTATSVDLLWDASVANGSTITGYTASTTAGSCSVSNRTASCTGLSPATTYTFSVVAVSSDQGNSSAGTATATTSAAAPSAPGGVSTSSVTATSVDLLWDASVANGSTITGYTASTTAGSCSVSNRTASCTGLSPATTYTFSVVAVSSDQGNSSAGTATATTSAAATPPPSSPPPPSPGPVVAVSDAPTGVSGTAGSSQVTVSWLAPASDGGAAVTGYTVTASPGGATCTTLLRGCTVSHLTNGTAYTFTVHATNSVGDSAESSSSAGVTPASPAPGLAGCTSGLTRFTDIGDSFAAADIACVNRLSIVHGRTDTTYDPASLVTREQATAMLARTWRSMGRACPAVQSQFTDIGGSFARADIECMWGLGIVHGVTDTIFDPGASVTRQEMAALLARTWRALGHDLRPGSVVFTDIGGSFARTDIESLRVLGITRGNTSSTKFDPGGVVTREQMAAFLARAIRAFAV